jgi:D-aminopeptidase
MCSIILFVAICTFATDPAQAAAERKRAREYGIKFGVMATGALNAITDVPGVLVGQVTLNSPDLGIRTGATAIVPYAGNIFQNKVPGAYFRGNGFGKMAGGTQVAELGNIETPIVLTNTLSIAAGLGGIIDFTVEFPENSGVRSVNGVVGETNDSGLSDIRGRHVTNEHVYQAIKKATGGQVQEGCVGAGMGTSAFSLKGGIGTSSRVVSAANGGWTVGVLVQTNFGGILSINGVPVGIELAKRSGTGPGKLGWTYGNPSNAAPGWEQIADVDGSCMIVVATDAPLDSRNLERLAKRAFAALAKTGSVYSNGSGDYVIAFSTAPGNRVPHNMPTSRIVNANSVHNDRMGPLFQGVVDAAEEAIINSLFMATDVLNVNGSIARRALPIDVTLEIMEEFGKYIPAP